MRVGADAGWVIQRRMYAGGQRQGRVSYFSSTLSSPTPMGTELSECYLLRRPRKRCVIDNNLGGGGLTGVCHGVCVCVCVISRTGRYRYSIFHPVFSPCSLAHLPISFLHSQYVLFLPRAILMACCSSERVSQIRNISADFRGRWNTGALI